MKITKKQLRQIIREEVALRENPSRRVTRYMRYGNKQLPKDVKKLNQKILSVKEEIKSVYDIIGQLPDVDARDNLPDEDGLYRAFDQSIKEINKYHKLLKRAKFI